MFKVGDKIRFKKACAWRSGYIYDIVNTNGQSYIDHKGDFYFYRVVYDDEISNESNSHSNTCNVFKGENIHLHVEKVREDKLNSILEK